MLHAPMGSWTEGAYFWGKEERSGMKEKGGEGIDGACHLSETLNMPIISSFMACRWINSQTVPAPSLHDAWLPLRLAHVTAHHSLLKLCGWSNSVPNRSRIYSDGQLNKNNNLNNKITIISTEQTVVYHSNRHVALASMCSKRDFLWNH